MQSPINMDQELTFVSVWNFSTHNIMNRKPAKKLLYYTGGMCQNWHTVSLQRLYNLSLINKHHLYDQQAQSQMYVVQRYWWVNSDPPYSTLMRLKYFTKTNCKLNSLLAWNRMPILKKSNLDLIIGFGKWMAMMADQGTLGTYCNVWLQLRSVQWPDRHGVDSVLVPDRDLVLQSTTMKVLVLIRIVRKNSI